MSFVGLQTENYRNGEFLGRELPGSISRDQITLKAVNDGATTWVTGLVLGAITIGTLTGAAVAGNTGNATIGTISAGKNTKVGVYNISCVSVTGGYWWEVVDPNGVCLGLVKSGAAFSNPQVNFLITAGGTNTVIGDAFTITVAAAAVDSNNKPLYTAWNPAATDGSQNFAGFLYSTTYMGGSANQIGTIVNYGAEVASGLIGWGTANATQIAAAQAQANALGIKFRPTL